MLIHNSQKLSFKFIILSHASFIPLSFKTFHRTAQFANTQSHSDCLSHAPMPSLSASPSGNTTCCITSLTAQVIVFWTDPSYHSTS